MRCGVDGSAKLVAFDVDGTLVGRDLVISKGVRDAIARMQRSRNGGLSWSPGGCIALPLPFARELDFDAPLICYQGAAIIDPADR